MSCGLTALVVGQATSYANREPNVKTNHLVFVTSCRRSRSTRSAARRSSSSSTSTTVSTVVACVITHFAAAMLSRLMTPLLLRLSSALGNPTTPAATLFLSNCAICITPVRNLTNSRRRNAHVEGRAAERKWGQLCSRGKVAPCWVPNSRALSCQYCQGALQVLRGQ